MAQDICLQDLGIMSYKHAWDLQEGLLQKNVQLKSANETRSTTQHHLLLVEHPPVYTLGKNGNKTNLLIDEESALKQGIEFFHINRGGDITFHGPDQLVGYPILDLDKFKPDLGWYLRSLEEVIILTLADFGLSGERSKGETGVWLDVGIPGKDRKICAMGIRCSRWITMHGFALNVNTNLNYFGNIIPCGIRNKQVTSLQHELGKRVDMATVKQNVVSNFAKVFSARVIKNNVSEIISH